MQILITGGTGFIGQQLVAKLAAEHQLTLLTRDVHKSQVKLGTRHHYISQLDQLANLDAFDAVINLAGEPIVGKRWTKLQKQRICDSRWDITRQLTALINGSHNPPTVFISASAIGYYGRQGSQAIDENAVVHEEFSHHICSEWERLANQANDHTRVCIIRIGIVLGLGGGALGKMLPPFKLGVGGPIGHGRQGMSWIHIHDLLSLISFLLTNEHCHGVFNATAPNPVSNAEFAKSLGHVLGKPAIIPTPPLALRLAMGEMCELLTEGQYVVPSRALKAGFHFNYPFLDQALNQLFRK